MGLDTGAGKRHEAKGKGRISGYWLLATCLVVDSGNLVDQCRLDRKQRRCPSRRARQNQGSADLIGALD